MQAFNRDISIIKKIIYFLFLFLVLSCSSDDSNEVVDDTGEMNLKEEHFDSKVSEINSDSAIISWEISQQGLNDEVDQYNLQYRTYLNDSLIAENDGANSKKITNLSPDTSYAGKILVERDSGNQIEITFSFQTLEEEKNYKNYFPLEVGNIWYYEDRFTIDSYYLLKKYQVTKEIISLEIIDGKEYFLVEETALNYLHAVAEYETEVNYPCTTTTSLYYLNFENNQLFKRQSAEEPETLIIDFNESPSENIAITEECDVSFHSVISCTYDRRSDNQDNLPSTKVYMENIGMIKELEFNDTWKGRLDLIGFKPVNSPLIGETHEPVCD